MHVRKGDHISCLKTCKGAGTCDQHRLPSKEKLCGMATDLQPQMQTPYKATTAAVAVKLICHTLAV